MIKGFFFDLDGTLVDTHQANFQAYRKALAEFGVHISFEDFKKTIGKQAKHFLPDLAPQLSSMQYKVVADRKAELYKDLAHLSVLNQALTTFMQAMQAHYVTGLVTTAKRGNASIILEYHKLQDGFKFIICAEDVEHSKPDPEAYQLALQTSHLLPEEVIAFEDSESGQAAASAAGIAVIAIKDFLV